MPTAASPKKKVTGLQITLGAVITVTLASISFTYWLGRQVTTHDDLTAHEVKVDKSLGELEDRIKDSLDKLQAHVDEHFRINREDIKENEGTLKQILMRMGVNTASLDNPDLTNSVDRLQVLRLFLASDVVGDDVKAEIEKHISTVELNHSIAEAARQYWPTVRSQQSFVLPPLGVPAQQALP